MGKLPRLSSYFIVNLPLSSLSDKNPLAAKHFILEGNKLCDNFFSRRS